MGATRSNTARSRPTSRHWWPPVLSLGSFGAVLGGSIGLLFTAPAHVNPLTAAGVLKLLAHNVAQGAGLAALVGLVYARAGRTWFWLVVTALGLAAALLMALTPDLRENGVLLTLTVGVIAAAFGLWSLAAMALHAGRTRKLRL